MTGRWRSPNLWIAVGSRFDKEGFTLYGRSLKIGSTQLLFIRRLLAVRRQTFAGRKENNKNRMKVMGVVRSVQAKSSLFCDFSTPPLWSLIACSTYTVIECERRSNEQWRIPANALCLVMVMSIATDNVLKGDVLWEIWKKIVAEDDDPMWLGAERCSTTKTGYDVGAGDWSVKFTVGGEISMAIRVWDQYRLYRGQREKGRQASLALAGCRQNRTLWVASILTSPHDVKETKHLEGVGTEDAEAERWARQGPPMWIFSVWLVCPTLGNTN